MEPHSGIDLSPVLVPILQALGIVMSAAVVWLGKRALDWLNIKISDSQQASFEAAATKSVTFGITQAEDLIRRKGWDHPEVKSAVMVTALQTMANKFPDTVKALGADPANAQDVQRVVGTILTRVFPDAATKAAESPVTPPTPPQEAAPVVPVVNVTVPAGTDPVEVADTVATAVAAASNKP